MDLTKSGLVWSLIRVWFPLKVAKEALLLQLKMSKRLLLHTQDITKEGFLKLSTFWTKLETTSILWKPISLTGKWLTFRRVLKSLKSKTLSMNSWLLKRKQALKNNTEKPIECCHQSCLSIIPMLHSRRIQISHLTQKTCQSYRNWFGSISENSMNRPRQHLSSIESEEYWEGEPSERWISLHTKLVSNLLQSRVSTKTFLEVQKIRAMQPFNKKVSTQKRRRWCRSSLSLNSPTTKVLSDSTTLSRLPSIFALSWSFVPEEIFLPMSGNVAS